MKKRLGLNWRYWFVVTVLTAFYSIFCNAQSLKRQCISTAGNFIFNSGVLVQQTVGQSYFTKAFIDQESAFMPGFQQALIFNQMKVDPPLKTPLLNLKSFPNPATNNVEIESTGTIGKASITITDPSGKILLNKVVFGFKSQNIDCVNWTNGLYIITVTDAQNNKYQAKILINKN